MKKAFEPIDDASIDRLVDGELDEPSRRELLLRLDASNESDAWRRCALAFLEAQAWGSAIRTSGGETCLVEAPPVIGIDARPRRRAARLAWLARAAALLLAFAFGWTWASRAGRGDSAKPPRVIDSPPIAQKNPTPLAPEFIAKAQPPAAALLSPNKAPIAPSYAQAQLERQGYRLEHERGLVPVQSRDGRRWAVPVDAVKVRFVGLRSV